MQSRLTKKYACVVELVIRSFLTPLVGALISFRVLYLKPLAGPRVLPDSLRS